MKIIITENQFKKIKERESYDRRLSSRYHKKGRKVKYTNDDLIKIAKKYRTIKEWLNSVDKNSYDVARHRVKVMNTYNEGEGNKFWRKLTSDMEPDGWYGLKEIYVFEFLDGDKPIAAYIGLSCDVDRRHLEHTTDSCIYSKNQNETAVKKFLENNPQLRLNFKKLTPEKVGFKEAQKLESYYETKYRNNGWQILNIAKTGGLGMKYLNSDDTLRNIALNYETKLEWKNNDRFTYNQAYTRGKEFWKDVTSHMKQHKNYLDTEEDLIKISKKYNTIDDWKNSEDEEDRKAYWRAYRRGKPAGLFLNKIFSPMS